MSFIYEILKVDICVKLTVLSSCINAVYASHVATTMVPIIAELFYNTEFGLSQNEIWILFGFYVPYLILPLMILVDSYIRVTNAISPAHRIKTE